MDVQLVGRYNTVLVTEQVTQQSLLRQLGCTHTGQGQARVKVTTMSILRGYLNVYTVITRLTAAARCASGLVLFNELLRFLQVTVGIENLVQTRVPLLVV